MILKTESQNMNDYLRHTNIIDYNSSSIISLARSLAAGMENEVAIAEKVYEFVRDKIAHSGDIGASALTCTASEVLQEKHGICCAKAHLFAAVSRCLNIPTGFCYQWLLADDDENRLVLHGLNAIYLKSDQRWIRLDARGNKPGVNAEFSIETEKLAWPVRPELGEIDEPLIYATPKKEVIEVLTTSQDRTEFKYRWISTSRDRFN